MSAQHSPGPWKWNEGPEEIRAADGRLIVCAPYRDADARLIAAAPEMLALLRRMYEALLPDDAKMPRICLEAEILLARIDGLPHGGGAVSAQARIDAAMKLAMELGGVEGEHHKAWAIDQMVRALTGCPMITARATDGAGNPYVYETQGESVEYRAFVAEHNAGDDGPDTYEWDEGIPP